ncbi:MAG TPA: hypothetical protein PKC28_10530 [Bdellovibrionales bacterium]|nr:hypothetical protein [Bdellovibrionales bacterium]
MNTKNIFLTLALVLSAGQAQAANFATFHCIDEEGVPLSISVRGGNPRLGFLADAIQGKGAFQSHYSGEYMNSRNGVELFLVTARTAQNQYSQLYVHLETNIPAKKASGYYKATGPFGDERISNINCGIEI